MINSYILPWMKYLDLRCTSGGARHECCCAHYRQCIAAICHRYYQVLNPYFRSLQSTCGEPNENGFVAVRYICQNSDTLNPWSVLRSSLHLLMQWWRYGYSYFASWHATLVWFYQNRKLSDERAVISKCRTLAVSALSRRHRPT